MSTRKKSRMLKVQLGRNSVYKKTKAGNLLGVGGRGRKRGVRESNPKGRHQRTPTDLVALDHDFEAEEGEKENEDIIDIDIKDDMAVSKKTGPETLDAGADLNHTTWLKVKSSASFVTSSKSTPGALLRLILFAGFIAAAIFAIGGIVYVSSKTSDKSQESGGSDDKVELTLTKPLEMLMQFPVPDDENDFRPSQFVAEQSISATIAYLLSLPKSDVEVTPASLAVRAMLYETSADIKNITGRIASLLNNSAATVDVHKVTVQKLHRRQLLFQSAASFALHADWYRKATRAPPIILTSRSKLAKEFFRMHGTGIKICCPNCSGDGERRRVYDQMR